MDAGALLEYVRPALCAHEAPDVVRSAAGALERAALLATAVAAGPTSDRQLRARWVPLLQSVVCDSAPLPWPPQPLGRPSSAAPVQVTTGGSIFSFSGSGGNRGGGARSFATEPALLLARLDTRDAAACVSFLRAAAAVFSARASASRCFASAAAASRSARTRRIWAVGARAAAESAAG
jgi:hypothetical protein